MLVSSPDGSESLRLTVDGLSRAMWLQDVSLARRLLRVSEVARTFAPIRDGKVFCLDPQGFEHFFVEIRRSQQAMVTNKLNQQLASVSGLTERAQIKSKLQASRRFQCVFFPRNRRLPLSGFRVRDSDGVESLTTSAEGMQKALVAHWRPVYARQEIDVELAKKLLHSYVSRHQELMTFSSLEPHEISHYRDSIRRAKNSAPYRQRGQP